MTESKVRIAIIGGGYIGPRHANSVKKCADAELAGIVEPSPNGPVTAEELETKLFASVEDMINSPDKPDAVIIATPNHTHVAIASQCARAGLHCIVEKPVCTDVKDGESLIQLQKECGVKMLAGHHRRFNAYVVAARKAIWSKTLGDVSAVSGTWAARKHDSYFAAGPWRLDAKAGGGPLNINLVHDVDILQHFLGPISRVYAEAAPKHRAYPVPENAIEGAAVTLRFKSGAVGTFIVDDNAPSPFFFESGTGENPSIPQSRKDCYRIFGTKATLSFPDLILYDHGNSDEGWFSGISEKEIAVEKDIIPFDEQVKHFVEVIRGNADPLCTIEDGVSALRVIEAVTRSLQTESPVLL